MLSVLISQCLEKHLLGFSLVVRRSQVVIVYFCRRERRKFRSGQVGLFASVLIENEVFFFFAHKNISYESRLTEICSKKYNFLLYFIKDVCSLRKFYRTEWGKQVDFRGLFEKSVGGSGRGLFGGTIQAFSKIDYLTILS